MKLIITALNAKYIHTSLSIRCLKNAVKDISECVTKEYSINDTVQSIASDIYACAPDAVAFSCYIWNIEMVLKVSAVIKKAMPCVKIILGGHEVSYDSEDILRENSHIDAVIRGEGEIPFRKYISALNNGSHLSAIGSLTYRSGEEIVKNEDEKSYCDLNTMDFAYDETIDEIKDRIIYYETSRGCPYKCSYCLSGDNSRVRFLDTERVKKELGFFMSHGVKLVKFVDRTFNANPNRAKEIFKFIAENPSDTVFHMEIAGDLIDDETIQILSNVRDGAIRFEIGVQTTNSDTMNAINRNISKDKLKKAVERLISHTGVHIHLDLIAGLPKEDLSSFAKSFDEVMEMRPHVLQLGFLKLLKGSRIRNQAEEYGYAYGDFTPYEVISNTCMSYGDIISLKKAEEALDRYYNSGRYVFSMEYLISEFGSAYRVFSYIGEYFSKNFDISTAFSSQKLYDILYNCFSHLGTEFANLLKRDYLTNHRVGKRPEWFGTEDRSLSARAYELFRDEEYKKQNMPWYYDVPAKEIMKHIHAERFDKCVLLFDYKRGQVYDISRLA